MSIRRRVLITGVGGFVGPYLRRELEQHQYRVWGIDRVLPVHPYDSQVDITDRAGVQAVVESVKPETVVHLVGFSSVADSWRHPDEAFRVNVGGTKTLLEILANRNRPPRVLVISSAEVYGPNIAERILENHAVHPVSPYGQSRLAQEEVARASALSIVIARSFNHTGPGQSDRFVVPALCRQAVEISLGRRSTIEAGDLSIIRDFSDVRDVVRAYRLIIERGRTGEVYNVCSGRGYRLRDFIPSIERFAFTSVRTLIVNEHLPRQNDIRQLIGNCDKLEQLGWRREYSFLDTTIRDIVDYWRQQLTVGP